MDGDLVVFALFVIAAFVGIIVHNWNLARHGTPIERWTKANGFVLLSEDRDWSASSRLLGATAESPQVYCIVVRDREGKTRTGRLVWGGWPLDRMQVTWDP
jgi:hypothetical protein